MVQRNRGGETETGKSMTGLSHPERERQHCKQGPSNHVFCSSFGKFKS